MGHIIISYGKILPNYNQIESNMKNLREKIEKFKNIALSIINRLNKIIENYENFYNTIYIKLIKE